MGVKTLAGKGIRRALSPRPSPRVFAIT